MVYLSGDRGCLYQALRVCGQHHAPEWSQKRHLKWTGRVLWGVHIAPLVCLFADLTPLVTLSPPQLAHRQIVKQQLPATSVQDNHSVPQCLTDALCWVATGAEFTMQHCTAQAARPAGCRSKHLLIYPSLDTSRMRPLHGAAARAWSDHLAWCTFLQAYTTA